MGCCQSTDSAAPHEQVDGARDVNAAQPPNAAAAGAPRPGGARRGSQRRPDEAPNRPVQLPTPVPRSPHNLPQHPPPWSRSLLERKRAEFFETQLSGNPQAWVAIRRVCELLREPNLEEAQAVLDATGLTTPRGQVSRARNSEGRRGGVYDKMGHFYEVPAWCAADPLDIVEDDPEAEKSELDAAGGAAEDDDTDEDDLKQLSSSPPRVEKGKGRAESPGKTVQVKCRRSDKGRDVLVEYDVKQPASSLTRRLREMIGDKRVRLRLIYRGRLLDESKTLAELGWKDGQVINAFVDSEE
ncbi:hypothetical protein LTS10_012280 [Elasticomyces elasticus]|nr:hypothetical protein LTS10_012280 [Elasticomyces elasticus]